jgi:hypothetical protein
MRRAATLLPMCAVIIAAAACREQTGALTPAQQQRIDSEGLVRRADDLMFRYTHDAGVSARQG